MWTQVPPGLTIQDKVFTHLRHSWPLTLLQGLHIYRLLCSDVTINLHRVSVVPSDLQLRFYGDSLLLNLDSWLQIYADPCCITAQLIHFGWDFQGNLLAPLKRAVHKKLFWFFCQGVFAVLEVFFFFAVIVRSVAGAISIPPTKLSCCPSQASVVSTDSVVFCFPPCS